MTKFLLYGLIRPPGANVADLSGPLESIVQCIAVRDVGAVASRFEGDLMEASQANYIAFQKVILELVRAGPVLPFSFGIVAPSDAAVRDLLTVNHTAAAKRLDLLDGKRQVAVRVAWANLKGVLEELLREHTAIRVRRDKLIRGASYGESLAIGQSVAEALDRKRSREADLLKRKLRPFVAELLETPGRDEIVAGLEALLPAEKVDGFVGAVEALDRETKGRYLFSLGKPAPPLAFSTIPLTVPA